MEKNDSAKGVGRIPSDAVVVEWERKKRKKKEKGQEIFTVKHASRRTPDFQSIFFLFFFFFLVFGPRMLERALAAIPAPLFHT